MLTLDQVLHASQATGFAVDEFKAGKHAALVKGDVTLMTAGRSKEAWQCRANMKGIVIDSHVFADARDAVENLMTIVCNRKAEYQNVINQLTNNVEKQ